MPNPALVFVPGAFARASLYASFVEKLKPYGFEVEVVDLPSTIDRAPEPPATVADDAAAIRAVASKYIEQGKDVHIHTHSYGGIPGTESIKGISKSDREASGLKGGVSRIVYTTSLALPVGASLKAGMGENLPDFLTVHGDYMTTDPVANSKLTFSGIPGEEAMKWANSMSVHSVASYDSPLAYPGYRDVDVSYIVCDDDLVIPLQAQEQMIEFLKHDTGKPVDVYHVKAGHAPHAAEPVLMVDAIRKTVGGHS